MTKNKDIRAEAVKSGVCLWQIAERLNMQDSNFSRLLRRELSEEQKRIIFDIIKEISGGK